jgi:hypothetical protein
VNEQKESAMNAEGIRRCVEEKEAVAAARAQLAAHAAKLDKEVALYERDIERAMESCDELARENDDLRARLKDATDVCTYRHSLPVSVSQEFLVQSSNDLRISYLISLHLILIPI